jgi:hypothetical protein
MPNIDRKRSNYEYQLPQQQLKALLEIAFRKDCSLHMLILRALDEYIQREEAVWRSQ